MGDGFRGRSSTWSAGTTSAYEKPDLLTGVHEDCKLAYPFASLRSGQFPDDALGLHFNDFGDHNSPKLVPHYSPASSTTATELGSQEFHPRSHLLDKTSDSDYGDTRSNLLTVMAAASEASPSLSMRDWNTSFSHSMRRNSGFQDVSSSSTFSPVSSFGAHSQGVLTPCGTGAGSSTRTTTLPPFSSSAPYPLGNGSGFPELLPAAASVHVSGSPSPATSQVSLPGPLPTSTAATPGNGGAINATKRPARRNPWGAETYSDLIANAIESYPEKQATLQQIYDYISRNYIYFRERSDPPASAGWKVSFIISDNRLTQMCVFCLYTCSLTKSIRRAYSNTFLTVIKSMRSKRKPPDGPTEVF
ncbi:unnamed protein product [Dibothriocephalus latus]|uniref:Fork-head domain-containing protein n=1 Tax=Dibothriocephalus latus TaxID=60516 RepID=A0A3P7LZ24_DIBLA|nr:unnamed protein product [Dibothriocephalus latus]